MRKQTWKIVRIPFIKINQEFEELQEDRVDELPDDEHWIMPL